MMVAQEFIDRIEELRRLTYSRITDIQKELCPMVKKIYLNYQFEYWYEGYRYNLWEDNVHVYAVNELPFCYDNEIKNTTFIDTVDNLVAQDKLWPFLFFINGRAVQWSKITVIHDYDYTYLKVRDILPDYSTSVDIVVFPLSSKLIRYGEDNNVLTISDRKGFYFDQNGKWLNETDFATISLRLEILDNAIYYKKVKIPDLGSYSIFDDLPDGFIPTIDNFITFDKNNLFSGNGDRKIIDSYNSSYNIFDIMHNPDDMWAILIYNTKGNKGSSYLYSKSGDLNRNSIIRLLTTNPKDISSDIWSTIIYPLIEKFDFDHDNTLSYEENIDKALYYITRYDFNLWKDAFKQHTKIKSFCYTGEEFKLLADDKGFVHFSRKHSDLIQDVVMMFVNSKLYDYEIDISYSNGTINIPIFGITNTDHVEILLFTECNNNILDIRVPNSIDYIYIHPDYNLEDCYIMSEECPDASYEVAPSLDGRKQYIVDFTYQQDGDNYRILFNKDYYYGKDLKIVPKRQFRYYRYRKAAGEYKIVLPTQFNYCHDPDRYMIFVNSKKIDRTEYTITIMNQYRPFEKLILYVSTILDEGDYIDIFYVPEVLVEKYKQSSMPNDGFLVLEDEFSYGNYPKTYPLSKDTTLIFINGLKVNPLEIKDVSLNSLLINVSSYSPTHINSLDNITIMEYLPGDKYVAGFLKGFYEQISGEYDPSQIDFNKSPSDSWKELIKSVVDRYGSVETLFGNIYSLDYPDENYKNNFADLRSILYDIVIDYYLTRHEVTTGDKFVYDFETEHFDQDTDGTTIINVFKDIDKLLDYVPTDLVAQEADVKSGQKFLPIEE